MSHVSQKGKITYSLSQSLTGLKMSIFGAEINEIKSGKEMLGGKNHFVRCQLCHIYFTGNKLVCVFYTL